MTVHRHTGWWPACGHPPHHLQPLHLVSCPRLQVTSSKSGPTMARSSRMGRLPPMTLSAYPLGRPHSMFIGVWNGTCRGAGWKIAPVRSTDRPYWTEGHLDSVHSVSMGQTDAIHTGSAFRPYRPTEGRLCISWTGRSTLAQLLNMNRCHAMPDKASDCPKATSHRCDPCQKWMCDGPDTTLPLPSRTSPKGQGLFFCLGDEPLRFRLQPTAVGWRLTAVSCSSSSSSVGPLVDPPVWDKFFFWP